MGEQTIRFRIRPDGRVEEVVEGVVGEACLALSERIEDQLGSVQTRQSTAAAFQTIPLTAQHPLTDQPAV
ncbi:MAG: DUF2997 domain-containing protein [Cyanobacteriota bacterium]|nr:DUF2997 domain-containing protein [Cyanobacteriota bacterium]